MKPKKLCFLIISLLLFIFVNGQTVEEVVEFANNQFAQGHFDIAAKEYNRALFFGYQPMHYPALRIAQCYFEQGNFGLSAEFYDKAYSYSQSSPIQNEALLGKAFCLIMKEEMMLALAELVNFNPTSDSIQNCEYHFLNGIALYHLGNDTLAHEQIQSAIKWKNSVLGNEEELNEIFEEVYRLDRRYSPNRSYYLSLIPGLGQVTIGEWTEGIKSLVLIGTLFIITNRIAIAFSLADAIVTIIPWLQRYYMGGMEKAKGLAESKIERKRYEAYSRLLELSTPERFK